MAAATRCKWDQIECLLKASFSAKEGVMLTRFVAGYSLAFNDSACFPRLHVVTYADALGKARKAFEQVPNVTVRANEFSPIIEGARHPQNGNANYYMAQWHAVWADNFTSAAHVLVFDVDSIPVMPLRCHHLFDQGRVLWRTWLWHHSSPWSPACSSVFFRAHALGETFQRNLSTLTRGHEQMRHADAYASRLLRQSSLRSTSTHSAPLHSSTYQLQSAPPSMVPSHQAIATALLKQHVPSLDMMAVFPIVVPRRVLPEMRRLVLASFNGTASCFDDAFVKLGWPSHADLIGKTALLQFPHLLRQMHCPALSRADLELIEPDVTPVAVTLARSQVQPGAARDARGESFRSW